MTWVTIKSTTADKKSKISFALSITKNGHAQVITSIPSNISKLLSLDLTDRVDVMLGEGEHAGKVRFFALPNGAFKIGQLKHAYVIRWPAPVGLRLEAARATADYTVLEGGFVCTLPDFLTPPAKDAPDSDEKPGGLEIDGNSIIMGGKQVRLTRQLLAICTKLAERFGRTVTKQVIHDYIYQLDPNGGAELKGLDVQIHKLRGLLKDANFPIVIRTEHGVGWSMHRAVT